MATSSWRLEDLHQLEELGLAGQLESTRLQETGAGLHSAEPDLTTVLSDLLMAPAVPATSALAPTAPCQPLLVEAILKAPTAYVVKQGSPEVTYINRGQWYDINLSSIGCELPKEAAHYRCVLSAGFSELRMRNNERELLESWAQDHPCERLLDIDCRGCEGVTHIQDSEELNCLSFIWPVLHPAIISIRINCLSSEFAAKKHGGEKGILLQLCMDFWSVEPESCLQRLGCNVKVFKDKGGDRKQKQDQLKIEKLPHNERTKYWPSQDVTRFSQVPGTSQALPSILSPLPSPSRPLPSSQSSTLAPTIMLSAASSLKDVHLWLSANHFSQYLSLFANYSGADLLRLSRRDLVELCGPADGIRLFNALRSRTLCTVYVCLEDKAVHQALSLEQMTAEEFACKLSEKVGLKREQVSSVLQLTNTGILVIVDDTVIRNFCAEDSFRVGAVKDETGLYQLLLRCSSSSQQAPAATAFADMPLTLDSSTEHS